MRRLLFLAALALADCTRGNLGENCNADGTCNTPSLACRPDSNGHGCYPKPEAKTCNGDADCFCEACLKRRGADIWYGREANEDHPEDEANRQDCRIYTSTAAKGKAPGALGQHGSDLHVGDAEAEAGAGAARSAAPQGRRPDGELGAGQPAARTSRRLSVQASEVTTPPKTFFSSGTAFSSCPKIQHRAQTNQAGRTELVHVPFHGGEILAVKSEQGEFAVIKPLCESIG